MELHYQSDYHRCHRYRRPDRSTKLYVAHAHHHADYHSLQCHAGRKIPFGGGLPTRSYPTGFRDIGYHFYITRDGEICQGRPLEKVGAHCRDHNTHSIGICYEGGLDIAGRPQDTRTLAQRGSLLALLRELRKRFPKALIVGHHDLNPMKECPCFNCIKEYGEL